MINKKPRDCVVLGILAIVGARSATAEQSGFYADVDLGQASYPYSASVDLRGVALSSAKLSIKDTSWGGTVGYRFIPYFGAEAGYVNLGKGSATVSDASGAAQGKASFTSKGATLALVGAAQVRNLEAFVRVGYLLAHTDLSVGGTVNGQTKLNTTLSANTSARFGGLGLRYAFSDYWHLKVEFDRYDDVGDAASTGTAKISVTTLGVGCRF